MIRKRSWITRRNAKRSRPKTPAPTTGWLIAELAELTQLPLRTLRYYIDLKLIVPTEFRGNLTRYPRRELLILLGIRRPQSETRLSFVEIKRKLNALGDDQLEAWLRTGPLPPSAASALGHTVGSSTQIASTEAGSRVHADAFDETARYDAQAIALMAETWQRIRLLPGLELMLCSSASPVARRVAQSICGVSSSTGTDCWGSSNVSTGLPMQETAAIKTSP